MKTSIYEIGGVRVECDPDKDEDLVRVLGIKGVNEYRFSDPDWKNWIEENRFGNRRVVLAMITAYVKNTGLTPDKVECGDLEFQDL